MMKLYITAALSCVLWMSCKKTYTCTCTLANSPDRVFTIEDTRKKAEKQCGEASKFYIENVFIAEYDCRLK